MRSVSRVFSSKKWEVFGYNICIYFSYNNPYFKRFCVHDVCNLKYVGKLECLSHKPSILVLFVCDSIWFAWFFVDIYLVALSCLLSVVPNILWLITSANFRNIETFHMKRQWWCQKFSVAIANVIIFVVISVHFT